MTPRADGVTVWFTGLSGAGKSTIAQAVATSLRRQGVPVEVLDGDVVRENLSAGLGFSKADRDTNIRRIGFVAHLLTRHGVVVLVAAISPYRAIRDEVRERIGSFVEIFVDCPLQELIRRDVKGLYERALKGEIKNFTGVDDPYEAPLHPELRIDSQQQSVSASAAAVIALLQERRYLEQDAAEPPAQARMPSSVPRPDVSPDGARIPTALPGRIAPHGGVLRVRMVGGERAGELAEEASTLPAIDLDAWQTTDLELLAVGALSPMDGFMKEDDLVSVRDRMRLASGLPWGLPVLLSVGEDIGRTTRAGQRLALRADGIPLAVISVTQAYAYDPERLAMETFGTLDQAHPGVIRCLAQPPYAIAGPVDVFRLPDSREFEALRLSPIEARSLFDQLGWRTVVGFQTRNPIHRAHEYLLKVALEQVDGLFLHPLVGETKADDVPASTRIRCYEALIQHHFPPNRVVMGVFPASMRYAGPREAIFHALVRQNYGCTHFIVGRDHAGVGSYYSAYAAQEIFDAYEPGEIPIQILRFEHAFYCRACVSLVTSRTCPHRPDQHLVLSGTRVRELLRAGQRLPPEFTRVEVAEVLRDAALKNHR